MDVIVPQLHYLIKDVLWLIGIVFVVAQVTSETQSGIKVNKQPAFCPPKKLYIVTLKVLRDILF